MRETRQSGSEGGGAGTTGSPYPYCPHPEPGQVARINRAMTLWLERDAAAMVQRGLVGNDQGLSGLPVHIQNRDRWPG